MKLTFSWLREFLDLRESPQKVAEALTMAGLDVEALSPLEQEGGGAKDWLMEMAVTPNRGDCLSIVGLARELAALFGGHVKFPPAHPTKKSRGLGRLVDVQIRAPRLCPRYSARAVENIRVAPSPAWMRRRLEACGIRSINNVVDITNYVMWETGQPLHAFDFDRLKSKKIVVRRAEKAVKFVTLDGVERDLAPEDLLICDGDTPVALAGVMGGMESEVQSNSRCVLLESANFDPLTVRRTAKRLGLHSEASQRFERGVDPDGTLYALDRAVFLLVHLAGGNPVEGVADRYPKRHKTAPVAVRYEEVERLLGIKLKRGAIERILKSLGVTVRGRSGKGLKVVPPSYRRDLTREADLIEELARLHGYDDIPSTLPRVLPQARRDLQLHWERKMRSLLIGAGLTEVINLPFTSPQMNRRIYGLWDERRSSVSILNPLAKENSEMRLSLVPGLVENLGNHVGQKMGSWAGFELGKVFCLDPPHERQHLAGLLWGQRARRGLRKTEEPVTFLDLKGLIEDILEVGGVEEDPLWENDGAFSFLHPGKAASLRLGEARLGYFGEIHPDLCYGLGLPPFLVFELDFERWVQYSRRRLSVRPIPRFPPVERDLAVVVDEAFPAQRIVTWIKDLRQPLIEDVRVFDEYRGPSIPENKKSLAYTISYRAGNRTLTDAEVNSLHQDLVSQIGNIFGAQLRG